MANSTDQRNTSKDRGVQSNDTLTQVLRYLPDVTMRLSDLLYAVASHLPRVVASPMLAAPTLEPIAIPLEGTAMFADINGFTQLSERFSQVASEKGAEELTDLVNRFLAILINTTARYGGDLQKFGGDAGMLLFTGERHAPRAVAAALEVQQAMHEQMGHVETSLGQFPLQISIGLGTGRIVGIGLGDREGREWLLAGTPLRLMGRAQSAAPKGSVVADQSTLQACEQAAIDGEKLSRQHVLIHGLSSTPELREPIPLPQPPQVEKEARLDWLLSRLEALTPYLAPGLLERLTTATHPEQVYRWSEHRQVTVLMLALSGIPDVSVFWQDPEALQRAVLEPNTIFMRARDVIHRFDGIVNKIGIGPQGPYLMALFGAPKAHEDDPLRATLAALELQEHADLPLRLGINSGFVFAGNVGTLERREYTVMGDEVNLAYRLMSGCAPGEVWLGPNTAQHPSIARRVAGERGAPQTFKGKSGHITPFIARRVRQSLTVTEMETRPLIGREKELSQLTAMLPGAATLADAEQPPSTRLAVLHGPAGIGKSHLTQALAAEAHARGYDAHTGTAPSYGAHLPYAVWERALLPLLALDTIEGPEGRAEALVSTLARYDLELWAALLAPLVGLDVTASPEVNALSPEMRGVQRQAALAELLAKMAQEKPRLLILENAQWMPSASLSLVDYLFEHPPAAPLSLLVTYRDENEVERPWQGREDILDLALEPLSRRATGQLASQTASGGNLPREVERWVAKRSSGVPLFTIEAVRALITSGILERGDDGWHLTQALEEAPLPETAYGVIQSRIDQLEPPSRHLLRAATVVGEQMTVPMLVAGYGDEPRAAVKRRLPRLAPLGLVPGDAQGETLFFQQPLIREVAYRGLPYRIRSLIHQRLAEYLDAERATATSNWLTLLAHHAFEGQRWELAAQSNLDLGQRALNNYLTDQATQALERVLQAADAGQLPLPDARFEAHHLLGETLLILGDYEQALAHLEQAQQQLPATPTTPEAIARLADIEYHTASALESQGRYEAAFEAVERGRKLPGVEKLLEGAQLYLIGANLYVRQGNYPDAEAWARQSARLAEKMGGREAQRLLARALNQLAYMTSQRGDPHQALNLGQRSLTMYQQVQDILGEMNARTNLLLIHLNLGQWADAAEHGEIALSIARRIHHTEGEARLSANLGEIYRYQGDFGEARIAYTNTLNIAHQMGMAYGEALMHNNLGAVAICEGKIAAAQRHLTKAEQIYERTGSKEMLPEVYRHRAQLHLHQGELAQALEWAQRGLDLAETQGVRQEMGRTHQCLAEIRVAADRCEAAASHIKSAGQLLQEVGDRYGLAQTALTRARYQHRCGQTEDARAYLREAIQRFEHLGAQWDLAQARALEEAWEKAANR